MAAPKGNKYAVGNSGNIKKFVTPEILQENVDGYFIDCQYKDLPFTIEGLCDHLKITRQTLLNYEKEEGYEEFFYIIKNAKTKIQRNLIERGLQGLNNPALTIFILKNNYAFKDKTEQDVTNNMNIVWKESRTYELPENEKN